MLLKNLCGITRAEREAIVVTASVENRCLYCVVAHGAALRMADLTPRLRTIADHASRALRRAT